MMKKCFVPVPQMVISSAGWVLYATRKTITAQMQPLSGFGVRGIGIVPDHIQGKYGFMCVLYVSDELHQLIRLTPAYTFHERTILALKRIALALKDFLKYCGLRFTISEAMALAMLDDDEYASLGIRYEDDCFIVPHSNLLDIWNAADKAGPAFMEVLGDDMAKQALDPWGKELDDVQFFTPDNPQHTAWVNFAFLPQQFAREISPQDYRLAIEQQCGPNFLDEVGQEKTPALIARLREAAEIIEENGWMVTL